MKDTKSKYFRKTSQLWLLKVALLFSVFTFVGFNENIQDTYLESDKTELVESRNYSSDFNLNNFSKHIISTTFVRFFFDSESYNYSLVLLNLNRSLKIKFRSISNQFLSYNFTYIKQLIKTLPSSPEGESLSFSIG